MEVGEQVLTDVLASTNRWEGKKQFRFSKATWQISWFHQLHTSIAQIFKQHS